MRTIHVHVFSRDTGRSTAPQPIALHPGDTLRDLLANYSLTPETSRVVHNGVVIASINRVRDGDHIQVVPTDRQGASQVQQPAPQPQSLLASMGLSEQEIANAHTMLRQQYGSNPNVTIEQLEDRWLNSDGGRGDDGAVDGGGSLVVDTEGNEGDTLWGAILGFFLGLFCVLFFRSALIKTKTRQGIIMGVISNLFLSAYNVQDGFLM
eukprot:PhM_4_TR2291/c0_g1_i1/m.70115